jgi:hypothetical protein
MTELLSGDRPLSFRRQDEGCHLTRHRQNANRRRTRHPRSSQSWHRRPRGHYLRLISRWSLRLRSEAARRSRNRSWEKTGAAKPSHHSRARVGPFATRAQAGRYATPRLPELNTRDEPVLRLSLAWLLRTGGDCSRSAQLQGRRLFLLAARVRRAEQETLLSSCPG